MITAGIDSGSRAVKTLILDAGRVRATALRDSGPDGPAIARACLADACAVAGVPVERIVRIVATGYGRAGVPGAHRCVTEITCHARGVVHLLPGTRAVIDIGGQDSKAIRLDDAGRVSDFAMNDRCAAGTGRFLEVVATRLGGGLPDFGSLATASQAPAAISSMCVVFAESEIVGLLAQGVCSADIAAGVVAAVASRVAALAGDRLSGPVAFTGGVALLPGFAVVLGRALGCTVAVPEQPQFAGALGAALLAQG